jgi:hypothetical protein
MISVMKHGPRPPSEWFCFERSDRRQGRIGPRYPGRRGASVSVGLRQHGIDERAMRRKCADRISRVRMAREQRGLATATAKVDLSLWTGTAGLGHPLFSPKPIETLSVDPNRF